MDKKIRVTISRSIPDKFILILGVSVIFYTDIFTKLGYNEIKCYRHAGLILVFRKMKNICRGWTKNCFFFHRRGKGSKSIFSDGWMFLAHLFFLLTLAVICHPYIYFKNTLLKNIYI